MATTAFGTHPLPQQEDSMEVSSPDAHNHDDDIDIDFDDYQDAGPVINDESMEEDNGQAVGGPDELMGDDMRADEQFAPEIAEEWMQDDDQPQEEPQQQEDEELIDYSEEEDPIQDQVVEDAALAPDVPTKTPVVQPMVSAETSLVEVDPSREEPEQVDEEIVRDFEIVPTDQAPSVLAGQVSVAKEEQPQGQSTVGNERIEDGEDWQRVQEAEAADKRENPEAFNLNHEEVTSGSVEQGKHNTDEGQASVDEHAADSAVTAEEEPLKEEHPVNGEPKRPQSLNTSLGSAADAPGTPTDTGLHPMNVRYSDRDMHLPLFKSKGQPEGLLKDDNLANLSLAELMKACRQRIAAKTGDEVSNTKEMHLSFVDLNLTLIEDSREAFETSLNDVVEVYLQLHRNDSVIDIPPLSLDVSFPLRFATIFTTLQQAAANGHGMSKFNPVQPANHEVYVESELGEQYDEETAPENEEENGEYVEYDEEQALGEIPHEGEEYDESTFVDQDNGPWDAAEEAEEPEQDVSAQYQEEDQHQESYDDPSVHENDGDDAAAEHHTENNPYHTDPFGSTVREEVNAAEEHAEDDTLSQLPPAHQESQSQAVGSSTDGAAGAEAGAKANSCSQLDAAKKPTLDKSREAITDNSASKEAAIQPGERQEQQDDSNEQSADALKEGFPIQNTAEPELGSEDFLDDLGDFDQPAEADDSQGQSAAGATFDSLEEHQQDHEEDFPDETDTYEEQQGEYHFEEPFGDEADDQFHTAHDLFDNEEYEEDLQYDNDITATGAAESATATSATASSGTAVSIHTGNDQVPTGDIDEDDIGFEEDEREQALLQSESETAKTKAAGQTDSPLGKRSLDATDADELDNEPDVKRTRSS